MMESRKLTNVLMDKTCSSKISIYRVNNKEQYQYSELTTKNNINIQG